MRVFKKQLAASFVLLSFGLEVLAQERRPTPTPAPPANRSEQEADVVRITTNLVQVDVVVTKDGKQITNLKPEDFNIQEDGRSQRITSFAYVSLNPDAPNKSSPIASAENDKGAPSIPKPPLPQEVKRTIAMNKHGMMVKSKMTIRLRRSMTIFILKLMK